jgi:hypothetical protein
MGEGGKKICCRLEELVNNEAEHWRRGVTAKVASLASPCKAKEAPGKKLHSAVALELGRQAFGSVQSLGFFKCKIKSTPDRRDL